DLVSAIGSFSYPTEAWFPTARMTIEMALLDALARSQHRSVTALLGLSVRTVSVGTSIGAVGREAIIKAAQAAIDAGSSKVKLKVSPVTCSNVISAIRAL